MPAIVAEGWSPFDNACPFEVDPFFFLGAGGGDLGEGGDLDLGGGSVRRCLERASRLSVAVLTHVNGVLSGNGST